LKKNLLNLIKELLKPKGKQQSLEAWILLVPLRIEAQNKKAILRLEMFRHQKIQSSKKC
jgi:hypothetical protein